MTADVVQFRAIDRDNYIGLVRFKMDHRDQKEQVLTTSLPVGTSSHWGCFYDWRPLSDSPISLTLRLPSDPGFRHPLRSVR